MDFIWILIAFVCGVMARSIALPPLIGYLIAGFLLNYLGYESKSVLQVLSDMGITLMLFTIGLKLRLKDIFKTEVWATTISHMSLWILVSGGLFLALSVTALSYFSNLDIKVIALIAFALSFSSTVCIVKILEESGELKTRHGKIAVAILVMQDIIAVVFMALATGATPSLWAFGLPALILLVPVIGALLNRVGHGELLPLMGLFLAFGAYELFYLLNIKGDLGALIIGVLLSGHSKSAEMYKSLISFKDIFLIGFFLSIGFSALPTFEMLVIALMLMALIPIKAIAFYGLLVLMKLRARTSFLSSLLLSNYSEFGLIVVALCVQSGWLEKEWLVILALAVSLSFVITSLIYRNAHSLYARYTQSLNKFESTKRLQDDVFELPKSAEVLVIGMGRVGKGTYQSLCQMVNNRVWGLDADEDRYRRLKAQGYRIFYGDGEDAELWKSLDLSHTKLVLIALPFIRDIQNIQEQLRNVNYQGKVAAIARYEDQIEKLTECGIDKIFNFYNEAGVGFAKESLTLIDHQSK